jgi:glutathionyl-hydroquinone reductase
MGCNVKEIFKFQIQNNYKQLEDCISNIVLDPLYHSKTPTFNMSNTNATKEKLWQTKNNSRLFGTKKLYKGQ